MTSRRGPEVCAPWFHNCCSMLLLDVNLLSCCPSCANLLVMCSSMSTGRRWSEVRFLPRPQRWKEPPLARREHKSGQSDKQPATKPMVRASSLCTMAGEGYILFPVVASLVARGLVYLAVHTGKRWRFQLMLAKFGWQRTDPRTERERETRGGMRKRCFEGHLCWSDWLRIFVNPCDHEVRFGALNSEHVLRWWFASCLPSSFVRAVVSLKVPVGWLRQLAEWPTTELKALPVVHDACLGAIAPSEQFGVLTHWVHSWLCKSNPSPSNAVRGPWARIVPQIPLWLWCFFS